MQGETFWGTTNIKVAAAASSFGAKLRSVDPVTRFINESDGSQQVTFWFQAGEGEEAKREMEKNWGDMSCDSESPIRYVRAALENRETLLGLVKRAEPIKIIKNGDQTLIVSSRATQEQKKAILRHI
jgi:hypothetical protein